MAVTLNTEARTRLDQHLDAVEAALLRAGKSREQRRAILDDLESQLLDMLSARAQSPTLADVEAILAQLDPPSAYQEPSHVSVPATPPAKPHSVLGIVAFITFCTAGVGETVILVLALSNKTHDLVEGVAPLGLLLCLAGAIFGLIGSFKKKTVRWPAITGLILNGLIVVAVMSQFLRTVDSRPRFEHLTIKGGSSATQSGDLYHSPRSP